MTQVTTSRVSGAIALVLGQWARYACQLISLVVLARILRPSDFGVMAMATAVIGLANVVGDFGLSLSAIRSKGLSNSEASGLFWLNVIIGVSTAGIIAAASGPLADFFGVPTFSLFLVALSTTFVLNGLAVQFKVSLNRNSKYFQLSLIDVIAQVAATVLAVSAAALGAGYWALGLQAVAVSLISLLLSFGMSSWRPKLRHSGRASLSGHILFGRDTLILQVLNYLASNMDSVSLGRVAGATILGGYNRAFQLCALPVQQIASPLTRIVLPRVSGTFHEAGARAAANQTQLLSRPLKYMCLLALSAIWALADGVVRIALGEGWQDVVVIVRVLALGSAFQVLGYPFYWFFLSIGETKKLLLSELPGRLIMVIGILVAVSDGPVAVAFAVAIGNIIIWATAALLFMPKFGITRWHSVRDGVMPLAVATVCALFSRLILTELAFGSGVFGRFAVGIGAWSVCLGVCVLVIPKFRADGLGMLRQLGGLIGRKSH